MTSEEIITRAVDGIVAQGALSKNSQGCFYFDPDTGNRCAVGHLVDEETARIWDKVKGGYVMDVCLPPELEPHLPLLVKLQEAHDGSVTVEEFVEKARRLL